MLARYNIQNEELTFKVATGNDWWFHAKGQPGSHVIVKSRNEELPDRTFEEEEQRRLPPGIPKAVQPPRSMSITSRKSM